MISEREQLVVDWAEIAGQAGEEHDALGLMDPPYIHIVSALVAQIHPSVTPEMLRRGVVA